MKKILAVCAFVFVCLLFQTRAYASVGVGVGTGRIVVSEKIKSGSIYKLPPISVFNTGTEKATYSMSLTLNEKQDQLKPNPLWFSFSPDHFSLLPGKSQTVDVSFHPPLKTQPGVYFGYLEAHPAETAKQGSAVIGVAAATKLTFTVVPSNLLLSIYYRILAIYHQFEPWSKMVLLLLPLVLILLIINKFINLRAALKGAWRAGRKQE